MRKSVLVIQQLYSPYRPRLRRICSLSSGYSFANVEEVDANAIGWRISGLYEFNQGAGSMAHVISFGYIGTSADFSENSGNSNISSNYKINSFPIYYAPKFMLGKGSAKGFAKGVLGVQHSSIKRTGSRGELTATDFGFYGGAGVGFMKIFREKVFINLGYEWVYMSNSYYKNGFMNFAMLGVGFKF